LIEIVPQTGSTNADLAGRLLAGEAVPEGYWLVTDRQAAGRGRLGRVWHGGAGNFMGSTVVHLRAGDPPAQTLALVAGLSLHDLLTTRVPQRLTLKWPNDLLAGSAKLAGILLERVGAAVVIGIGVNLASAPDLADCRTVALPELGGDYARDSFAGALSEHFTKDLERWRTYGLAPIVNRWGAAGHPVGTALTVEDGDGGRLAGRFAGLTEDGALQLRLEDGRLRVIQAGETRLA
jgi:BirA family biotin operon repressor/biotin-[acetyl-CoA-carboxylase] ligase